MAGTKFDAKSFNPEAFGAYTSRIPNLKRNELLKSRALKPNQEIRSVLSSQTGTGYATFPIYGTLDGTPVNYDGVTDIDATSTKTFEQSVVSFGRAKAWTERDFSFDITAGTDFMSNVAKQVSEYWEAVDQDVLLSILKGIFAMTGANNQKFVEAHTNDVSAAEGEAGLVGATTLNNTIQKACGANKGKFSIAIMHSQVATNLENLRLLKYMTYTDKDGIQRDLALASWNGRAVLIDDSMPVEEGESGTKYTTYVLGDGAFFYEDLKAKVPYEMARDPKTNGGQDTLYTRQRKVIAPYGISYTKSSQASLSPTNEEFANGANWTLIHDGGTGAARTYIDHKAIAIARIISRG